MYDVYVWQREKTSKIVWKSSKVLNIRRRYTVSVKKKKEIKKKKVFTKEYDIVVLYSNSVFIYLK